MKLWAVFIVIVFSLSSLFADDTQINIRFQQGNEWYKKGEYNKAIEAYFEVQTQNKVSYALLFNMANAYYKLHQYGLAILHYERAKKYYGNTEELEHNLALCKKNIIDKESISPFKFQWHLGLPNMISESQWAWMSIVFMILLLGPVFLVTKAELPQTRKFWFNAAIFVFIMLLLSLLLGFVRRTQLSHSNQAIVMGQTIQIQSEPIHSSKEMFVIHEGTKVDILRREGDWINIAISNGNEGWCLSSALEEI